MTQIGPVDQLCLVFSTLADGWPSIVLKTNGFPLPSKGLEGEEGSCGGGREWKRCTCQWERCEEEDGDEDEEAEAPTGKRVAEDDEDDDVDTKKQKTEEDD